MISSDFFEDDFIGMMEHYRRLLWIGLFATGADDQGRMLDSTAILRGKIFPYDRNEISDEQIEESLQIFANAGKIIRYRKDGKMLIQIVKWWTYQTPSWAYPSKFPPPDGWTDREKYHSSGNKVIVTNWDKQGGLSKELCSALPTPVDSGLNEMKLNEMKLNEMSRDEMNSTATANFFSKFQSIAGPLMGNKQVDQIKDLLEENGAEKILEIARWLVEDKGETSMNKIIAAIRTAAPEWKSGNSNESVFEEWLKNGNKTNSNAAVATLEQASPAVQANG